VEYGKWLSFDLPNSTQTLISHTKQIEFSVGTIAACLPTLKPLFKDLLETARSTRSRIGSYRVNGTKSSSGYLEPSDPWGNKEIALDSYPSNVAPSPTSSKTPYAVRITTQPAAAVDKGNWEAQRRESEEGNWPLRPHHALGSNGIVRTREITREVSIV
jgi:hypothetical protein